jgi:hypothetical protein
MNSTLKEPLLILTVGGLGDLLCSEPVIRYGLKEVFTKSEEILIVIKEPSLFSHFLKNPRVRLISEEELYKDIKSYIGYSVCATYEHPLFMKKGLIQGAMHSTDYASVYLLGRLIPETCKKIYIDPPTESEIYHTAEKFKNLGLHPHETFLIHPGETWPSRTIPMEWWEEFIKEYKKPMCLIGQHRPKDVPLMTESPSKIPEHTDEPHRDYVPGVLDLNCKVPSLIDQLSFRELVTAIYLCKGIITNDSVPVHIAGAFDNYLFTFATAREWFNLRPYDHFYSYNFATDCYYPAVHFRPTKLIGSVDLIPENSWETFYGLKPDIKHIILSPKSAARTIERLWN